VIENALAFSTIAFTMASLLRSTVGYQPADGNVIHSGGLLGTPSAGWQPAVLFNPRLSAVNRDKSHHWLYSCSAQTFQLHLDNNVRLRSGNVMKETKAPAKTPELTLRSIAVGLVVALIIGSAYPYCVLKLGFGPNLSVVSAFFGFIALVLIIRASGTNARENNIVQTMGTSAGQTAFMCVLLAAFDLLNAKGVLNPPIHLGTWQIFFWLCSASLLGILLAVPMRRHYIDEENLTFADGLAAGETIRVLHEGREKGLSAGPLKALAIGTIVSGVLMIVTNRLKWIRDTVFLPGMQPMNIGFNVSLLSFGSGLLVGFRVCLAMAIGTAISWFILPSFLLKHGMITEQTFPITLRWVMWPATGLMVSGGLTSLALKWNLESVKTFRGLKGSKVDHHDFPMRWVAIGSVVMTVVICLVQYFSMHIPVYLSFIAILLSLPMMLVGLRVLGENELGTNQRDVEHDAGDLCFHLPG